MWWPQIFCEKPVRLFLFWWQRCYEHDLWILSASMLDFLVLLLLDCARGTHRSRAQIGRPSGNLCSKIWTWWHPFPVTQPSRPRRHDTPVYQVLQSVLDNCEQWILLHFVWVLSYISSLGLRLLDEVKPFQTPAHWKMYSLERSSWTGARFSPAETVSLDLPKGVRKEIEKPCYLMMLVWMHH